MLCETLEDIKNWMVTAVSKSLTSWLLCLFPVHWMQPLPVQPGGTARPIQRGEKHEKTSWHWLIQLCCDAELNQQLRSVAAMQISNWQQQQ